MRLPPGARTRARTVRRDPPARADGLRPHTIRSRACTAAAATVRDWCSTWFSRGTQRALKRSAKVLLQAAPGRSRPRRAAPDAARHGRRPPSGPAAALPWPAAAAGARTRPGCPHMRPRCPAAAAAPTPRPAPAPGPVPTSRHAAAARPGPAAGERLREDPLHLERVPQQPLCQTPLPRARRRPVSGRTERGGGPSAPGRTIRVPLRPGSTAPAADSPPSCPHRCGISAVLHGPESVSRRSGGGSRGRPVARSARRE